MVDRFCWSWLTSENHFSASDFGFDPHALSDEHRSGTGLEGQLSIQQQTVETHIHPADEIDSGIIRGGILTFNVYREAVVADAKAHVFPGAVLERNIHVEQRTFKTADLEIHRVDRRIQKQFRNQLKLAAQRHG